MAKRRRESDSDSAAPVADERMIAYVDTSLETCLGVAISKADTLSDLKKKVVLDHLQIFPEHGEIMVDRLKVQRKGKFYPLADSTLVRDVFPLVKTTPFFFADTSSIPTNYMSPKSLEHGESEGLRVELGRASNENHGILSLDVPKVQPLMISLPHGGDLENCEMMDMSKVKSPAEKRSVFQCNGDLVESSLEAQSRARKKLKIALNGCIKQSQTVEHDHDIFHETDKDNLMVDAVEKVSERILVYNQLEKPLPAGNVEATSPDVAREIDIQSIYVNLQSHLASDSKKADTLLENVVDRTISANNFDNEPGQNAQVDNVEGVGVIEIESSHPVRPVDKIDKTQKRKSGSKKKRKRRDDKRSAGVQDSQYLDQGTENAQSVEGTCINMGAEKSNIESIANSQDVSDNDRRAERVLPQSGISENVLAGKYEKEHGQNDQVDCPEFVTLKELNLSGIERNGANQDADCSNRNLTFVPAVVEESVLDSQYQLVLDKTKEYPVLHNGTPEFVTRESENKLGEINPAKHLEDVTNVTGTMGGGKSTGSKKKRIKKKKKAHKEFGEIQDTSNLQLENGKGEFVERNTETLESGKAKESVLSLNLDEGMMLPSIKTSDVSLNLLGEFIIAEAEITSGSRKKKKKMKRKIPADTNLESDSAFSLCSTYDHSLEESGKNLGVKFSDPSAGDASEQNHSADTNMTVFVAAQTEQTLVNAGSQEVMGKKDQCSDDVNPVSTVMVKDNLESNQIDDIGMSTQDKRKTSKKKGKKILNAALHVETNLPGKDQKVDADVLATQESLTSIKNPELQERGFSSPIVPDIPQENTSVVQTSNANDNMDSESALKGSNVEKMQENITSQRKAQEEADEIQYTSNIQHETRKGEFVEPNVDTLESGKAKESALSLNLDEVMMSPFFKNSAISPNLLGEVVITEAGIMSGSRRKKKKKIKGKIPADNNLEINSAVSLYSTDDHSLEETGEDIGIKISDASERKDQNSGDVNSDSTVVKDNLESNQIDEIGKSTKDKWGKTKKKRKKILNAALDVEANLPGKDQRIDDANVLATKESLTSIKIPELQQRDFSSPIVPENNTGVVQNANNPDGEINFADYFVPGQSNQKSSMSALKGSNVEKLQENMTIQKQNEALPVSSYIRETTSRLVKSSSEGLEMFQKDAQVKSLQKDLDENGELVMRPPQNPREKSFLTKLAASSQDSSCNSTNMKTAQKKSLLAKAGSIFQDYNEEESTDENGGIYSNDCADSSDSSSDSDKETGFNDEKGKNKSRLNLSDLNGMTIDKLLRSSSQYRKAKLQASQSELEVDGDPHIVSDPSVLPNP